ncbi:MAG: glycosyltransferase [Nitrospiraceae bacterium]|nr:glycosyltransferase [Nitrospiraceae bacterium]
MKILHISALPIWSMDGKGGMPSLQETLRGHLRGGHDIQLILPGYDLFSDEPTRLTVRYDEGYDVHVAACRWYPAIARLRALARRISGGKSVLYPARWLLNVTMSLCLTFSLCWKSVTICRAGFRPHLVYANNQYAALAGYLLGRLWRVPNVTRLYGTFLADLIKKPFVTLRYPAAAAGYLVPSSLLICANDGTRGDEVARKFRIPAWRFRFWQNGVEPPSQPLEITRDELVARFGPRLKIESKWVVSCSRLSYWKRIDRILCALAVCRNSGVDCQLLVAGDGPEKERLHALAEKLDIAENTVWLGAIAHDDIWALMNVADAFMITNDVTNRCNPLYEAAWAGLPVVSIFDPSTADLLQNNENSLLASKDDTEALGKKLAELCNNEALRRKLCAEQKKLAASFWTWEKRMRVEVAELEKLVNTGNQGGMKDSENLISCR